MHRTYYFLLLSSFFIILLTGCQQNQDKAIHEGKVSIQPNEEIVRLSGYWNFYREHLLGPMDSTNHLSVDQIKVPGYWDSDTEYGTIELVMQFSERDIGEPKAIYIPQVFSAYKLWVNDELMVENGKVATSKKESIPRGIPKRIYFNVSQEKMILRLQVSNFYYRQPGILGNVYVGSPTAIEDKLIRSTIQEWFSIGAFIIFGINHMLIYINRKKERLSLFFALFCLLYGIRMLLIGQASIYYFFPDFSMIFVLKLNYICIFVCLLLFIKYFYLMITTGKSNFIVNFVIITSLLCIVLIILSDPKFFTNLHIVLYFLFFITFSYLLFLIMKGIKKKQVGINIVVFALIVLIATIINDLAYDAQILKTIVLNPYGLLLFIGAQSFMISKRFAGSFSEIEFLSKELENTQKELLFTLGEITETRSKETGNHVKRVAKYSYLLALKYGLSKKEADLIKAASTLHDVGKIGIPDSILNKPGKLTEEEYGVIKKHTTIGHQMLKHTNGSLLKACALIALTHHEKYDGSGYPKGLQGEDIPLYGRIVAISDVFDALSTDRIYKKAWKMEDILAYFQLEKGKHFDPKLVDIFLDNVKEFIKIKDAFKDEGR